MKVLLLGATGRTGRLVLEELLHQKHQVHALVRDRSRVHVAAENLQIFEGDTRSAQSVYEAMRGCDVLINVLNVSRKSDFPWARLRTPECFLSETMQNVINIAGTIGLKKLILCSAWGVHETKYHVPLWFRWFINNSNIGKAYRDHERQEERLRASDINYVIVRPVGLTNLKTPGKVRVTTNNNPRPRLLISRSDVAKFLVNQIYDQTFLQQTVTISRASASAVK
jgi:uncharacterized protein YbjT (DUF2867 family)